MPDRPRLLLFPSMSELEWDLIRPQLEEWADVASFDLPGVGEGADPRELSRENATARALEVLAGRGWRDAVFAGDQFGSALAIVAARAWDGSVRGLALGHACLHYGRDGERRAISQAVADFQLQITELSPAAARQMLAQALELTYGAETTAAILGRLPEAFATEFARFLIENEDVDFEPDLRALGVPLLLAEHEECGMWTPEGFEDAVAAFPEATVVRTPDNPGSSPRFAEALREFALSLAS